MLLTLQEWLPVTKARLFLTAELVNRSSCFWISQLINSRILSVGQINLCECPAAFYSIFFACFISQFRFKSLLHYLLFYNYHLILRYICTTYHFFICLRIKWDSLRFNPPPLMKAGDAFCIKTNKKRPPKESFMTFLLCLTAGNACFNSPVAPLPLQGRVLCLSVRLTPWERTAYKIPTTAGRWFPGLSPCLRCGWR